MREAATHLPGRRDEIAWVGNVLRRDTGGAAAAGFVTRFEQTTGPATAKGVEDTAFYRYHRLIALNEVGGDPGEFGRPVDDWHDYCSRTARDWPTTMTTLSTHDTKRTEDVRARLLVLAEIPDEWEQAVAAGAHAHPASMPTPTTCSGRPSSARVRSRQSACTAISRRPPERPRNARAGPSRTRRSSSRCTTFVDGVYADDALMSDVGAWVEQHLVDAGRTNSLAQKLLQLTMPGVPDVYQGQELAGFALVDPDNRRPVDYDARRSALDELDNDVNTVDPKLLVTATALRLRQQRASTYAGSYSPVRVTGQAADHAVAFARGNDVITVVTRLPVTLHRDGGWRDTALDLPEGRWRNALTGEAIVSPTLESVLQQLP